MNLPCKYSHWGRLSAVMAAALAISTAGTAKAQNTFTVGTISQSSQMPDIVPFELQNGLIVLKASVGDGLMGPAILDTGLASCIAAPEFATKHGMKPAGLRDVDILDRSVRVSGAPVQSLRINRVALTSVMFGVFDLFSHLSATPPKDGPPLWIGNSALAALTTTIDPQLQRVILRPAGMVMPPNSTVVPFEFKQGRIWVDVKVNGKKSFSALLDTGSVGTMLPASVAKALALTPATTIPFTHPDGKEGKVCAVDLTDIALGGLKVTDVQAIYIDQASKDGFDPEFGIIGNDILLRYRITIDYSQKKIAFEKISLPDSDKKAVTAAPKPDGKAKLPAGTGGAPVTPSTDPKSVPNPGSPGPPP